MTDKNVRNVKLCLSLNESARVGSGIRIHHGYGNTLSSTSIDPFLGAPRMKTDTEYQIRFVLRFTIFTYLLRSRSPDIKMEIWHGCEESQSILSREAGMYRENGTFVDKQFQSTKRTPKTFVMQSPLPRKGSMTHKIGLIGLQSTKVISTPSRPTFKKPKRISACKRALTKRRSLRRTKRKTF